MIFKVNMYDDKAVINKQFFYVYREGMNYAIKVVMYFIEYLFLCLFFE